MIEFLRISSSAAIILFAACALGKTFFPSYWKVCYIFGGAFAFFVAVAYTGMAILGADFYFILSGVWLIIWFSVSAYTIYFWKIR